MLDLFTYPWIKALHIIAVICWMAGMLYLPRLFVYHAEAMQKNELSVAATLTVMEGKLLRIIMLPAMVATYIFGLWLALLSGVLDGMPLWFVFKMFCVLTLSAIHGFLSKVYRKFRDGSLPASSFFFRILNEVITFFMVVSIILVVVRPFSS